MQRNFFTGRAQLYNNKDCSYDNGVSVSVDIGNVYIENNITVECHSPKVTISYGYDELKPLFKKVI